MLRIDTVPILAAHEVKEKLRSTSFRDVVPKLVSHESLQEGWIACSETEIITEVFKGNPRRAHYFLEQLQKRPELKVSKHPEKSEWCLDVASWNGCQEFSMKVFLEPEELAQQVSYQATDVYIINTANKTTVSVQSLLPIYQGAVQHIPIDFRLIFRNPTTPADEKELSLRNLHSFSAGDSLTLGEVHQVDQMKAVLHEAGHIWTYYLEIFSRTHRQNSTNSSSFSFSNDAEEHGAAAALQLASEIGFSERMANFIGRILDIKLAKCGFYATGQRQNWLRAINADGSTYDAAHAMLHVENYEAVRPAFVSRSNRTEAGRNYLVQEAAWMKDKIDVFLLWTERLPADIMVKRTYLDRVISEWQSKTAQGTFRCAVKRDLAGTFRSAEVVWETGSRKIQVTLTDFHGVSFFDSAIDPTILRYIEVGREYTDLAERKQQFESTLRQLVDLQIT